MRLVRTEVCSQRDGFTFLAKIKNDINQKEVGNCRLLQLTCHEFVDCFYQKVSEHDVRLGFVGNPKHVPYSQASSIFLVFLPV